jgi:DNA-binding PadR family transcriptional regulator
MSPVFRHGNLRLYLLKLLDEAPRHGYEVIRLLQDRFLGVYAPSPGTIYPRLARLEEEGLVTHDEVDGRKVYRITDKGRAELHARLDDLAALEEEITASVRDIAREVSEDVRETVRNLREELASAARDIHGRSPASGGPARAGRAAGSTGSGPGRSGAESAWAESAGAESAGPESAGPESAGAEGAGPESAGAEGTGPESAGAEGTGPESVGARSSGAEGSGPESGARGGDAWQRASDQPGGETGGRRRGARRGWGEWSGWGDWSGWADWSGKGAWHGPGGHRALQDLERAARQFARDLRTAAWHAQVVSEDALDDLRDILDQAMDRIRSEVFTSRGPAADQPREREPEDSA